MWYIAIMFLCIVGSVAYTSYCFLFNKGEFEGYYKKGNVENLVSYLGAGIVLSLIWPITLFISTLVFAHKKLEKRKEKKG